MTSPFASTNESADSSLLGTDPNFIDFTCGSQWLDPDPSRQIPEVRVIPDKADLIAACASGDITGLQILLHISIKEQHSSPRDQDTLPAWEMVAAAIERKQPTVVQLLLETYPQWDMCEVWILRVAFANPHLETFKVMHSHSPKIINMEFQSSNGNALIEACTGADPTIPEYLLDHGAWVNEGGCAGCGPLWAAVIQRQLAYLIKKMVHLGAIITGSVLNAAIDRQDPTILEFLLNRCFFKDPDGTLQYATRTNNGEIIALVEKRAKDITKQERKFIANKTKPNVGERRGHKWAVPCRLVPRNR